MTEPRLLAWSAPDERAETKVRQQILDSWPDVTPDLDPDHEVRAAAVVTSPADLLNAQVRRMERAPRPVALLLDGHGAQHVRMGAQLRDTVFTAHMRTFFEHYGEDALCDDWLAERPAVPIDAPERGQPLLFALGHALGRLVMSWGVRPTALLGHSVGELAAAALAGVLTVADAAGLMARRAESYRFAVAGGLVAVAGAAGKLTPFLSGDVCVGVINGPHQTMLAGPEPELTKVTQRLRDNGFTCIPARIPLPFHAPVLEPLARISEAALAEVTLRPPDIDVYSTITARRLLPEEATDPSFWAEQVCRPVLFGPALDELLGEQDVLLVEAGPSKALTTLARKHPAVVEGRSAAVAMLPPRPGPPGTDRRAVLEAAAAIWLEGHELDWDAVGPGSSQRGRTRAVPVVDDTVAVSK